MVEQLVGETDLQFHRRRVKELEALHESPKRPPGERSAIKITGRGDGLTTGIHDALTGEDLGARYGVRKVELKIVGEDWDGATLVLELGCPVIAELTGCSPPVTKPD